MKICDALTIKLHRSAASYPIMNVQIQSNLKLPVWPVYGGVVAQLADWFSQPSITELILNNIGGRVVPMFLSSLELSPFLLLVHHTHSFTKYDPIRPLTNLIVPEGFPAHPHSGFSTVTYCLKGGLRHRDSEGIKMSYGNGDVQWMRAGRGTIHEEMWDVKDSNFFEQIEIFQLWVNLPSNKKGFPPKVTHIRSSEIPEYRTEDGKNLTKA
jgi:redox-sensitive bicupin YhaK (pirin superfamily)